MPRRSPYRIELSDEERAVLTSMARSYTLPYWQVIRAQMVLMAADGMRNDEIAARLNCGRDVVSQWRKRFFEQRLAGLEDRPRRGRPPAFPLTSALRSSVWPANYRQTAMSRWRAGQRQSWPPRRSPAGSPSRSPGDRMALVVRGRDQAVAAPVLDLPARPRLRRQGRPHP
jgi:hypothetical protein